MNQAPAGFEVPLHTALTIPVLVAGVPRTFAILNGTMTAVIALGLHSPWFGLPIGFALHAIAYWITKRDPFFFGVLRRHLWHKPFLDA